MVDTKNFIMFEKEETTWRLKCSFNALDNIDRKIKRSRFNNNPTQFIKLKIITSKETSNPLSLSRFIIKLSVILGWSFHPCNAENHNEKERFFCVSPLNIDD